MRGLFLTLLTLHLAAALVAYGPALSLPFLSARPAWAGVIVERLSLPSIVSMPFTGAGMVVVAGINPATQFWLWASIVLYLASLAYLLVRQRPRVLRLLRGERSTELTKELRRATIGLVAVIAVIGAMMVFKPGR